MSCKRKSGRKPAAAILRFLKSNAALSRRNIAILFIIAFAATFIVRTLVCHRDVANMREVTGSEFTPFLVEGSMMYSYALACAYEGGIPEYDRGLAEMENIRLSEQMPIGLEPFLGYGLRAKNALPGFRSIADPDFVRFQACFWVSLGGGFLLLWLLALRIPAGWSLFGALLYAVAPAAVARATGQDLLCEVFALPFLISAFAAGAWYLRRPCKYRALAFTVSVFGAVAFWDISQFIFAVWALVEMIRSFLDRRPRKRRFQFFLLFFIALVLAAVLTPYHRAHGMIASPALIVIFPMILLLNSLRHKRRLYTLGAMLILGLGWWGISHHSAFSGNYDHFSELLQAKIRHSNVKPRDPAKLTFMARALWTPALHSADWQQVKFFFPAALWGTGLLLLLSLLRRKVRRRLANPQLQLPLVMSVVFFIIFIYLFRFHVPAVIFLSVSCAILFYLNIRRVSKPGIRVLFYIFATAILFSEARMLYRLQRSYDEFSLREISGLVHYLQDSRTNGQVFLASMELSPLLKAYAKTSIVVQPKFEFPATRAIFRDYVETLFSPQPREFVEFCTRHHVDFFVYFQGTGTAPMAPNSYRYMAGATNVPRDSAAFLMDAKGSKALRNFYEITIPKEYGCGNRFRLFRVIKPADIRQSKITAELAMENWHEGNRILARRLAVAAFLLDPQSEEAYLAYYRICNKVPDPTLKEFLAIPRH